MVRTLVNREDQVQSAIQAVNNEIKVFQKRQDKAVDDLRSVDQTNREFFEAQTEGWRQSPNGDEWRRRWRLQIEVLEEEISVTQMRLFGLNHELACLEIEWRQIRPI